MGVYTDARYPFFCGDGDGEESYGKLIKNILKQIDELNKKIDELQNEIASADNKSTEAIKDAKIALSTAQQALNSMQALLTQINAVRTVAENASLMATDAETKANEAKEIAQGVDDKATEAQEKANEADNKATQVMDELRDVVEVQLPIISRVATNAMETAGEADRKADEALSKLPFLAVYDVTPYADVRNAINQGRPIFLMEEYQDYPRRIQPCFAQEILSSNIYLVTYSYAYNSGSIDDFAYAIYSISTETGAWSTVVSGSRLQAKLYAGVNIKNINNQSLIGSGNIEVETSPELELGTAVQIATYKEGINRYRVFQKVIDLGTLPNSGSKTVAHGIDKTKVLKYLSIQGSASQDGFGNTLPLPCVTLGSESVSNNIYIAVGGNNVTIATGRDRTAYTGTLTITYVDNTPIT